MHPLVPLFSPTMRTKHLLLVTTLIALTTLPALAQPAAPSPWPTLAAVRDSLADAGPLVADFSQTFVPAGFSTGDTESGQLSVSLPDCLRWDYEEPYPKSFLLCGEQAHAWNGEDRSGRRYSVDREEEPGLDLLMLSVDTLRGRYQAEASAIDGGRVEVRLSPNQPTAALTEATLTVDTEAGRLTAVSYRDREGNATRFEVGSYRPLGNATATFRPPTDVRWEE